MPVAVRGLFNLMLYCLLGHGGWCRGCDLIWRVQAMADIFALGCIQSDVMFRNDDYIAAEKVSSVSCDGMLQLVQP